MGPWWIGRASEISVDGFAMDRVPLLFTYLKRQVHFEEHVCTLAKYGLPNGLRASPKSAGMSHGPGVLGQGALLDEISGFKSDRALHGLIRWHPTRPHHLIRVLFARRPPLGRDV